MNTLEQAIAQRGFRVVRPVERPQEAGRSAHFATHEPTKRPVILEQFQWSEPDVREANLQRCDREVKPLAALKHSGIPPFVTCFRIPDGLCLVQSVVKAKPLSTLKNLTPEQIQQIAHSALEALVYLQSQSPAIVHRNLRPETIWVDAEFNAYLTGFEIGSPSQSQMAAKSADSRVFLSREQLANRPLTEAADLYSLGVTLICLLTQTPPSEVTRLIGKDGNLSFKRSVPTNVSLTFVDWLETLVQPLAKDRYANAAVALAALQSFELTRMPEAAIDPPEMVLTAQKFKEKLVQTIVVKNPVPDTVFQGKWEVVHPTEAASVAGSRSWITIAPTTFQGNVTRCQVTIDTGKLRANQSYRRQLLLHANTGEKTHRVDVQIQTAPLPLQTLPYATLAVPLLVAVVLYFLGFGMVAGAKIIAWIGFFLVQPTALMSGYLLGLNQVDNAKSWLSINGAFASASMIFGLLFGPFLPIGVLLGSTAGAISGFAASMVVKPLVGKVSTVTATIVALMTAAFGASLGIGLKLGFGNLQVVGLLAATGLPLVIFVGRSLVQNAAVLKDYRASESSLIRS